MRVLSKITVIVVCFLALLTAAGCDSGFQMKEGANSIIVNGWELSSPEGIEAIRSCTASEVVATKNEEIEGTIYSLEVAGNAQSVLDRVSDPFFGKEDVNYEDPDVKKYIGNLGVENPSLAGKRYVSIGMIPSEGPVQNARQYDQNTYMNVIMGATYFPVGATCSRITVDFIVPSTNPATQLCGEVQAAALLSNNYKPKGATGIVTYQSPGTIQSTFLVGWWKWRVEVEGDVPGRVFVGISW